MRLLTGIDNAVIAIGVLVVLVLAPLAAVYQAVTGHLGAAAGCLGLFAVMLVVIVMRARDAVVSRRVRPNAAAPRDRRIG